MSSRIWVNAYSQIKEWIRFTGDILSSSTWRDCQFSSVFSCSFPILHYFTTETYQTSSINMAHDWNRKFTRSQRWYGTDMERYKIHTDLYRKLYRSTKSMALDNIMDVH